MLSVPIQITTQEIHDFPLESIQIDPKWKDLIDPEQDHKFHRPRGYSKKKTK